MPEQPPAATQSSQGDGQAPKPLSLEELKAQAALVPDLIKKAGDATALAQAAIARAEKAEESAKGLQARRDKAEGKLTQMQTQRVAGSTNAELQEFANQKAREAMLYKELNAAGLKEEDLPQDIEFQSPGELRQAIQIALLNRKIAAQDQRLDTAAAEAQKQIEEAKQHVNESTAQSASRRGVDTGGPSGQASAAAASEPTPAEMRERAKKMPRGKEAVWLVLGAAHKDPDKVIGIGSGGPTE